MDTDLNAFKAAQAELDADRRRQSVDRFRDHYRAWAAGDLTLKALSDEAGDALEAYAVETLDALAYAAATLEPSAALTTSIVEQYHGGISAVGAAIRDTIEDSTARHTVAQTLQARVLRAESRLRQLGGMKSTVVERLQDPS